MSCLKMVCAFPGPLKGFMRNNHGFLSGGMFFERSGKKIITKAHLK